MLPNSSMIASLLPRLRCLTCTTSLRCFAAEAGEESSILYDTRHRFAE